MPRRWHKSSLSSSSGGTNMDASTSVATETVYWALERDATDRGLRLVLDRRLAARVPRPPHPTEEPGLDRLLELVVGPGLGGVLAHERLRAREHRLVDRFQHGGHRAGHPLLRRE